MRTDMRSCGTLIRQHVAAVCFTLAVAVPPISLFAPPTFASSDATSVTVRLERLGAVLQAWEAYKERHIEPSGRVVDGANGDISHSEGQGYAMLIAAKLADRETFDRVWTWTWQNLGVRSDHLFAWQWSPNANPNITDGNNATDGDILIAWALMEAADLWDVPYYREAAQLIARDIATFTLADSSYGKVILPAVAGFGPLDRPDGPVVNLSYWIFPAKTALKRAAPSVNWDGVFESGARILRAIEEDHEYTWPSEWTSLSGPEPVPADGFEAVFGYNAVRIPLYTAWAGPQSDLTALLEPFRTLRQSDGAGPFVAEAGSGQPIKPLREPGFAAVATLTECALAGQPDSLQIAADLHDTAALSDAPTEPLSDVTGDRDATDSLAVSLPQDRQNYYPETLNILAALVQLEAHPSCLD